MPEFLQPISSQHQTHECHEETHKFKTLSLLGKNKRKNGVTTPKLKQELVN